MKFFNNLRPQYVRDQFISEQIAKIPAGQNILDAGCGSQRYKQYCQHLHYLSQDFGEYKVDDKRVLGTAGVGGISGYQYGNIDYVGDIWNVKEEDSFFDNILCTEVFEHIPYPNETILEFSRLLKPGGRLILTFPSNCTRHMDPYYFYSGFSDRWAEFIIGNAGFVDIEIRPVGDYYSWMFIESYKSFRNSNLLTKLLLMPSMLYYFSKKPTATSINTMCVGYHVMAKKFENQ